MNWPAVEIADALVTAINGEDWVPKLKVVRRYSPVRKVDDGEQITGIVLPFETAEQTLIDRSARVREAVTVSINIQRGVRSPDDNNEIDPLTKLLKDVSDFARQSKMVEFPGGEGCGVFKNAEIAFDFANLRDPVVFSGWTNLTYTVVRA